MFFPIRELLGQWYIQLAITILIPVHENVM